MKLLRSAAARVTLAITALTVLVTHPLLWQAARVLPGDLGDPVLNTFLLGWGASRMRYAFSGVWSAPFYFPLEDTLALSEHLLGISVFTAPVVWLTGNPVLAQNLAFLGSYVLAGVGMYLLAGSLWGRKDAAFLAALAFAFAPHRLMHVPHLQVLMSGWMPISLWGLHRYFGTGSRRSLAVFAGAFAVLALSNGYFLYFFSIPVALVVICELARAAAGDGARRARMPWRTMAELAVAAAAILAALAPAALAYTRVRQAFGFRRAVHEMAAYSAAWSDYLRIPSGLWVWSGILDVGAGERMLFPGLTIVALAVIAAATARRRAWPAAAARPAQWGWHVGIYSAILVLAVWLSAGPSVPGPYGLLLRFLPGFDGLRVPARLIVVVALALCVLGSAGAAWILSRLGPRTGLCAAVVLGAAIVLEGYGGRMYTVPFRHDQRVRARLNEWIRSGPPGGVLELPIVGPAFEPFTLAYQYNTLLHGHPIVNGYSGYGYGLQDFLGGPGSPLADPDALPGLLDGLRAIGVRYIVLHQPLYLRSAGVGMVGPEGSRRTDRRRGGHAGEAVQRQRRLAPRRSAATPPGRRVGAGARGGPGVDGDGFRHAGQAALCLRRRHRHEMAVGGAPGRRGVDEGGVRGRTRRRPAGDPDQPLWRGRLPQGPGGGVRGWRRDTGHALLGLVPAEPARRIGDREGGCAGRAGPAVEPEPGPVGAPDGPLGAVAMGGP